MSNEASTTDETFVEVWTEALTAEAANHDLTDPDGRADFRIAVVRMTSITLCSAVIDLANYFGGTVARNASRPWAARELANAWITRTTGRTVK